MADLKRLCERVESYGLRLEALENVPRHFYEKAMLGLPGRDQQIENYQRTIRNMAEAGIPILGYGWMPNWVWRTPNQQGRGGVTVTAFDMDRVQSELAVGLKIVPELAEGQRISAEEMWANYSYFAQAVVCEIVLRCSAAFDDPPLPEFIQGLGNTVFVPIRGLLQ